MNLRLTYTSPTLVDFQVKNCVLGSRSVSHLYFYVRKFGKQHDICNQHTHSCQTIKSPNRTGMRSGFSILGKPHIFETLSRDEIWSRSVKNSEKSISIFRLRKRKSNLFMTTRSWFHTPPFVLQNKQSHSFEAFHQTWLYSYSILYIANNKS